MTRHSPKQLCKNSFFIFNAHFPQSPLHPAPASPHHPSAVHLTPTAPTPHHLWTLVPDPQQPDHFYIETLSTATVPTPLRLTLRDPQSRHVELHSGHYFPDQLWRFVRIRPDVFLVSNVAHPRYRLTQWSLHSQFLQALPHRLADEQLWTLVPRFSASVSQQPLLRVLPSCNKPNHQQHHHAPPLQPSSSSFSEHSFQYVLGVLPSQPHRIRTGPSFVSAAQAALHLACQSCQVSSADERRLSMELSSVHTSHHVQAWNHHENVFIEIPARDRVLVSQFVCRFSSLLPDDDFEVRGHYVVDGLSSMTSLPHPA